VVICGGVWLARPPLTWRFVNGRCRRRLLVVHEYVFFRAEVHVRVWVCGCVGGVCGSVSVRVCVRA
jgi:hypothetical protein